MNPAQLSAAVVGGPHALVDDGALILPDGVPTQVTVERPEGGSTATTPPTSRCSWPRGPGAPARARRAARDAAARGGRHRRRRGGRPRLPQHERRRRRPGRGRGRRRGGRGVVRPQPRCSPGQRINVEFISANPTGPLHLGHTRWAAVGDAIAPGADRRRRRGHPRVLHQRPRRPDGPVRRSRSMAAAHGQPTPEDGYPGDYIADLAAADRRRAPGHARPARRRAAGRVPRGRLRAAARASSRTSWPSSTRTSTCGSPSGRCTSPARSSRPGRLREQGHVYESDGAVWMRTTDFGDDKDRVLIRSNGELTYFASDTAYYIEQARARLRQLHLPARRRPPRLRRAGSTRWRPAPATTPAQTDRGADRPAGQDPAGRRGARLSKRAGTIITLRELVDEVGVDAAALLPGPLPGRLAARRSTSPR